MKIDFSSRKTTLVATPVDGRCGLNSLSMLAENYLGIRVTEGKDFVVFISKSRRLCKVIFWDERGACLVTRRLHSGCFARYLMEATGPAAVPITPRQLEAYLDGESLQVVRQGLLKG